MDKLQVGDTVWFYIKSPKVCFDWTPSTPTKVVVKDIFRIHPLSTEWIELECSGLAEITNLYHSKTEAFDLYKKDTEALIRYLREYTYSISESLQLNLKEENING